MAVLFLNFSCFAKTIHFSVDGSAVQNPISSQI